tara:strand:+ start:28401 stop:28685 length:285 start_codon:yes stop_codon:yes gene_type:complete
MTILCIILSLLLLGSVYKNITFGMTILRMEDSIEDCLDIIDEKYELMSEVLQRPLFFDSQEVKSVVRDIKAVRGSLHSVALTLTKNIEKQKKEE